MVRRGREEREGLVDIVVVGLDGTFVVADMVRSSSRGIVRMDIITVVIGFAVKGVLGIHRSSSLSRTNEATAQCRHTSCSASSSGCVLDCVRSSALRLLLLLLEGLQRRMSFDSSMNHRRSRSRSGRMRFRCEETAKAEATESRLTLPLHLSERLQLTLGRLTLLLLLLLTAFGELLEDELRGGST